MSSKTGLDEDGGISFSINKKPVESQKKKKEERLNSDKKEDKKIRRLDARLSKAKRIRNGGFVFNGTFIISILFYLDSILYDPSTVESLSLINELTGYDIDFENIIAKIQGYKSHMISFATSSQLFIMQYKNTVQRMRDEKQESFLKIFNQQLKEIGI